jgi:hypothetical protein
MKAEADKRRRCRSPQADTAPEIKNLIKLQNMANTE